MQFQTLFALGMKRTLPDLIAFEGRAFDIGASGRYIAENAIPLGLPDWSFPRDKIPANDDSVATLHCYHFLEHLSGEDAIAFLREAERVMIPNQSVFNFCIPYYGSLLSVQDLTHKSFWGEENFRTLFDNHYYSMAGEWRLHVHFIMIAGIVQRNLALIGQIVKR
jgi:hypothetical protein